MVSEDFDLDALLAEADAVFEAREPEFVPVVLAGRSVGVRYLPLDGPAWRKLTLEHPPRAEILQDLRVGYDVDAVVAAYPDVVLVSGDTVDDMVRTDAEGKRYSVWPKVCGRLSRTGLADVAASMWDAHERATERLVGDAGKASPDSGKKKRS